MTNIVTLKKATPETLSLVGEKAVNCNLLAQKFPVPATFIVTATAFSQFLEETALDKKIKQILNQLNPANEAQLQHTEATIRNMMSSVEIPEAFAEELTDAYYSLNISADASINNIMEQGEDPIVVVRPSAINYNGKNLHQSLLGIQGKENLKTALLQCWASFYTTEILKRQKQQHCDFAVIVQKMIDSQASGVFYTSYKMNAEEVLILGCKGLGTVLQTGVIAPDNYYITKKTLNTAAIEVGKQLFFLERDFDSNKILKEYVQEEYAKKQKLSAAIIGQLTMMSNEIEKMFSKPQIVDFALFKETLWLLGTAEAEWYQEKQEREQKEQQRRENLLKVQEQKEEELLQKEQEISTVLTQELEQDALVVSALHGTAESIIETEMGGKVQEMHSVIQPTEIIGKEDPNDINSIILNLDFAAAVEEVQQQFSQQSAVQQQSISEQRVETSVVFEQQKEEDDIEQPQPRIETELTTVEKAAGEMIIHCFTELKAILPKEQWAASPELRHVAVLAQNFSQKNVPPNPAQVKFAMDAVDKTKNKS